MHVKKGDHVLVLAGNDRGKSGEVLRALPGAERVVVAGVNLRWKHRKPSQQNPKGERVRREQPIHASNVRKVEAARKDKAQKEKAGRAKARAEAEAAAAPKRKAKKKEGS